jgi:hypothetical protein
MYLTRSRDGHWWRYDLDAAAGLALVVGFVSWSWYHDDRRKIGV